MKRWFLVIIWCGAIFYFSSIPYLRIEALGFWDLVLRKIAHLLEFAILCVLLFRAIESSGKKNKFWPVFLSFTYAITDEIHQYYIPGRYTSLIDVLIDTAGSIAGLWVYRGGKQRVADSR